MQSQDETQAAKDAFIEAYSVPPIEKISSFTSNNLDVQDDGKLKIKEVKSTPDNEKITEVIWTRKLAQVGNIKIK